MQLHQTILCFLLITIAPTHLFGMHRLSRQLNLEQPTESTATVAALKNAETGSLSSLMDTQPRQEQKVQDLSENTAAIRATLNSPSAAIIVASADDYRKPAFVQHMEQFMENSNTNVVYVIEDNDNSKSKRDDSVGDSTAHSIRGGRQLYPIVALDIEPTSKPTISTGTGYFSITPIAFDWRAMTGPFAAFLAPATDQRPLRIWAIGSVAKFPPFLEHFVQRIQAYYSVYKYEDLSRPGFHHSDGTSGQVVRVSTSPKIPLPIAEVTAAAAAATDVKNDETTSAIPVTTSTMITTITSKV